ncbi:cysteine--tRNA ligase [Haploplasma axanthum]|uniref:Cysteine--tRNA ligase n=1 Tax=Haploplasma axanthum TaxID=29552 RepID=A0A449BCL9_HAPAX|nr:cysteine--tRNA ligase [Haploplasma axanthum]VEU80182.1 Cysteine--tRNA ligase [Haploplasma axanthum]
MLKIYNTLTKIHEDFIPIQGTDVSMYVCGPTVYSYIHIGNARPVIFFDVLRNYLSFLGYKVNYVSNITDVDDKIINESKKLGITEKELTTKFTEAFIDSTKKIGSDLPNQMPKATDYIDSMIDFIDDLINKGYAYKTESGVYFDTNKVPNYGELSGQNKDELNESVRISNQEDKKDFRDFTLWKKTHEGIAFKSPWGIGRPGWHTECAVMNKDIFNGMIDIHGGGTDLIFPHHENENAQTIAHSGHELSKYWMHVGRVDIENTKMSKSIGNTIWVKDLKNPMAYRLLVLAHQYRLPINYSDELLVTFEEMYDKISRTVMRTNIKIGLNFDKNIVSDEYLNRFKDEMNKDLNTANVVTLILEIIKELNKEADLHKLTIYFNTLNVILGILNLRPTYDLTEDKVNKYNQWNEARKNKDYQKADSLRKELLEEGWI